MNKDEQPTQPHKASWMARLAIVLGVLALVSCACGFLLTRLLVVRIPVKLSGSGAAGLNPLEAIYLETYLGLRAAELQQPAAPNAAEMVFEVAPGSSAGVIAGDLVRLGLVGDATLFKNYVRYAGLDDELEAGKFKLSAAMTIPEIAQALTEALSPDVTVQVVEGRRLEEIADLIDATPGLAFTGADFRALVGPGAAQPPQFDFLASTPAGASLEGFLFPDTYRLAPDAAAVDLRDRMLANFGALVTPQMRADAAKTGFTLYEIVTLASIVEREAALPDERPLIAGVYLNRLANDMKLDADPTVQYGMGQAGNWWPQITYEDYTGAVSPYNTYLNPGLPPGPIANPGLASIEAVIYPAESEYLYFRACDGSGEHRFSRTFAEHEAACD
ncbi:MAG: endolytic transglycosylase MltG [Anaerolineae bacterium]|nr:endolytic transglycosylase MltG [Anaerolineae bacterium]